MTPAGPVLHPDLSVLDFLIGTWEGAGSGSYPGSEPFEYAEELTFAHEGKPLLAYAMRTWRSAESQPSHSERGFWRCRHSVHLDAVVAHATGHVEVSVGTVDTTSVELRSTSVIGWRGAKEVLAISRKIWLEGDVLTDSLGMQAVGHELQDHVVAKLRRR